MARLPKNEVSGRIERNYLMHRQAAEKKSVAWPEVYARRAILLLAICERPATRPSCDSSPWQQRASFLRPDELQNGHNWRSVTKSGTRDHSSRSASRRALRRRIYKWMSQTAVQPLFRRQAGARLPQRCRRTDTPTCTRVYCGAPHPPSSQAQPATLANLWCASSSGMCAPVGPRPNIASVGTDPRGL